MNQNYGDILSRIDAIPEWFDERAVPRFDPFEPSMLANIYANEAVLFRIECQCCGQGFDVAMSTSADNGALREAFVREGYLRYGDPPNIDCCESGPGTTAKFLKVIQYWCKGKAAGNLLRSGMSVLESLSWYRFDHLELNPD